MYKKYIVIGVILYLVSTLVAYGAFSLFGDKTVVTTPPPIDADGKVAFDDTLPRTEPCPLNGELYSKQQRSWWEEHRPMGVMIENSTDARPQSGLTGADIVYETVAEGGITRFLAVFYCQDGGMVGPVRSARTYFIDFISEYGDKPLYVHVGGANVPGPANALGQLSDYGWVGRNDINQFSVGFPTFWRDYERLGRTVATEHTMYSTTEKLWKVAADRKLTNEDDDGVSWDDTYVPWEFKEDAKDADRGTLSPSFGFWDGYEDFAVAWKYDPTTNTYKRENGGQSHLDKNNDKQITAKSIVVILTQERHLNDEEKHLLYTTKGKGQALFFFDGNVVEGTWQKVDRESRMQLLDERGKAVTLTRGPIWVEVLPIGNEVTY